MIAWYVCSGVVLDLSFEDLSVFGFSLGSSKAHSAGPRIASARVAVRKRRMGVPPKSCRGNSHSLVTSMSESNKLLTARLIHLSRSRGERTRNDESLKYRASHVRLAKGLMDLLRPRQETPAQGLILN